MTFMQKMMSKLKNLTRIVSPKSYNSVIDIGANKCKIDGFKDSISSNGGRFLSNMISGYTVGRSNIVKPGAIVGFCNPLLDMTVVGNQYLLNKYGLKKNDAILAKEEHMPLYDEILKDNNVDFTAGGSGQNSLRVAQWILKKPNTTVFFGAVGKDKYSDILKQKAKEEGVDVKYQYSSKKPTGTCAVIVTNNGLNRSLCANLSAAKTFSEDHLNVLENKKIIENAQLYLVTGFFLQVNATVVCKVAKIAFERKRQFLFNLSAPFIYHHYMDFVMSVYPYINIIIGNDLEAKAFSEGNKWKLNSIEDIAHKMSTLHVEHIGHRLIIITQSEKPVIVVENGVISKYPVNSIPITKIVDTNGAGDSFIGGFISQYILGFGIEHCVKTGIKVGSYIVTQPGVTKDNSFCI